MNQSVGASSILFLLSVVLPCAAAERAVLLEACAAMADAGKRADCFEALARMPIDSKPSQQSVDFQGVNRAATALLSAIDVGVSYRDYGTYVQQLATEVALLKQRAKSNNELAAVSEFEGALDAYRDAASWWETSIRFYARRDNETAYAWGLPIDMVGAGILANRYSMPVGKADLLGFHRGVPHLTGLQTIWRVGRQHLDKATSALNASQAPAAAVQTEPAGTSRLAQ